jgi:hypothetical protein
MRVFCRAFVSILFLSFALSSGVAFAEVPDLSPEKLELMATHIFSGKIARIYSSVELSADWETTYSVAELQLSKVEKGKYLAKLLYVRFWRRRWKGKGEAPDGAYGHRAVPALDSTVRVFAREGEDGGYDVVSPNGFELISAPAQENKKTSEPG